MEKCCNTCKWYEFDLPDFEEGTSYLDSCNKTSKGNLKGFPFKNELKCYEINKQLLAEENVNYWDDL